ncbi:DUF3825 domain-containing protein [Sphingobacterium multivorum]|uniref:DUF3825 domain-containing protein n=1 Tax=Sphingobacterium multivorum TaxID=28454 RepID=UPI0028AB95EA|nr:DUF3825 domain-containing protein [Sphingobacterium multivorum]
MEEKKILEILLSVIDSNKSLDGWADLATLGAPLSRKGLNYKALGYLKLKDLIEVFENEIELKKDKDSFRVPILYARKKANGNKVGTIIKRKQKVKKVTTLMEWAWMGDFSKVVTDLKNMALKERWYYKQQNPSIPYPILSKYLIYTFFRLLKEKNKIKTNQDYAAFNTGLVNNLYEPIYALFEKNRNEGRQEWYFCGFCISGVGNLGKKLVSQFNPLPERAHYFSDPSELIYDSNAQEPQLNWNHIILDNVKRLPIDFLEENKPSNFLLKDITNMSTLEKNNYYNELSKAIVSYYPNTGQLHKCLN